MKHSGTRQNIVQTASSLFYKNGFNSTGINEIIAEAGIAKATLYNHFKSKEDICIAYLQHMNSTFIVDIEQFCRAKKKGSAQVLGVFDFLQIFFKDRDFNGCWCIKTVAELPKDDERVRKEIQSQKKGLIQLIEDLLEVNLPDISSSKRKSRARQVYLMYEGAVAESHLHQEDWPIKEAKSVCKEILS